MISGHDPGPQVQEEHWQHGKVEVAKVERSCPGLERKVDWMLLKMLLTDEADVEVMSTVVRERRGMLVNFMMGSKQDGRAFVYLGG